MLSSVISLLHASFHLRIRLPLLLFPDMSTSSIIYTTIEELSSNLDEFLAERPQFDSDHCVDFSAPTCCQSANFVRPLFAFYCPLVFTEKKITRHFATDAMFTLRDLWICVIDQLRCANDGATALRQINR